eukprot:CAMPEP_0171938122 /NCGR_PEP_ID=MMETSP0993-20121228/35183_1 /TAXON_ID=483369 /ORGANISM="non described non described, Strain CCMP2098" /LENGTH=178 /DNA_ID=CAMNT_0012579613 /DNA_START=144 /DNA_END=680 /DNA_ORIENTATION=-
MTQFSPRRNSRRVISVSEREGSSYPWQPTPEAQLFPAHELHSGVGAEARPLGREAAKVSPRSVRPPDVPKRRGQAAVHARVRHDVRARVGEGRGGDGNGEPRRGRGHEDQRQLLERCRWAVVPKSTPVLKLTPTTRAGYVRLPSRGSLRRVSVSWRPFQCVFQLIVSDHLSSPEDNRS